VFIPDISIAPLQSTTPHSSVGDCVRVTTPMRYRQLRVKAVLCSRILMRYDIWLSPINEDNENGLFYATQVLSLLKRFVESNC